jgi:hypothetical protein
MSSSFALKACDRTAGAAEGYSMPRSSADVDIVTLEATAAVDRQLPLITLSAAIWMRHFPPKRRLAFESLRDFSVVCCTLLKMGLNGNL